MASLDDPKVKQAEEENQQEEEKRLRTEVLPASKHCNIFLDWLDIIRSKDLIGISSGFPVLDEKTMGLHGLMLLCSQPNAGKSTFCVNIALNHLKMGGKVIYITLDMTVNDIFSKFIQLMINVDFYTLINKKTKNGLGGDTEDSAERGKIENVINDNGFFDRLFFSQEYHYQNITKEAEDNTLIIIDYLQVIETDTGLTEIQKADKQIDMVRDLQHETSCPVLAIAEARKSADRKGEAWAQTLSDIKGSGRLVYTPDMVFLLRKDSSSDDADFPSNMILDIVKIRDGGQRGSINYFFDWKKNKFEEERAVEINKIASGKTINQSINDLL